MKRVYSISSIRGSYFARNDALGGFRDVIIALVMDVSVPASRSNDKTCSSPFYLEVEGKE